MMGYGRVLRLRAAQLPLPSGSLHARTLSSVQPRKIKKLMAANRSEIAIRIFRAATELDIQTVAIYSKEDIKAVHRYKADEAHLVAPHKGPVAAYLSVPDIVRTALDNEVDAIHPGYGFLSESVELAQACEEAGIVFVGPTSKQLSRFGDKTMARALAIETGLPVVGGTPGAVASAEEAQSYIEGPDGFGYPVIIKAAHGGGGRGMRIVTRKEDFAHAFATCSSEAESAFGNGTVFVEQFIHGPRHVEVQVLGDGNEVVHLYERDCSVQRRHQKVVEIAPAPRLAPEIRDALCKDAVKLTQAIGYRNAGTVEFLVDPATGGHYFMEVNPRIQVEHTVTEQVTGVDLVQSQIKVASGQSLGDLGLTQDRISTTGYAIQCRITTEDPLNDFAPDTGRIDVWRPAGGFGIRLDSGSLHAGARVLPFYDSMLMKITGHAPTFEDAIRKLTRALTESRIRGVKTNVPFLLNVLRHQDFASGVPTTRFIEDHPELMEIPPRRNRANKLLHYLGDLVVNGRRAVGARGPDPERTQPIMPVSLPTTACNKGWRNILLKQGPAAFAQAVRKHQGHMLMDTTWRDAHQSLLATRVRTKDLLNIAPQTSHAMQNLYSIENWGGATFDVAMRFLHECPWDRLGRMREAVPNIPFQMLFRGANAVGYKVAYPDNVISKFCEVAKDHGMDIFRVFDSLNYLDNLLLGIEAAGAAGGVVEGTICYTGDVTDPDRSKYDLEYYLNFSRKLASAGVHVLCVKDMAGLLKPQAARVLVSALRREHPNIPIHVHTHDTSGLGVAAMIAALESGADIVDAAVDSMSGMTSQPSMGALVSHFKGTDKDFGVDTEDLMQINDYWESVRSTYSPFESGQKSGSFDVFENEIPGGQYTNLHFQAYTLGLASQWRAIKKAYAAANRLCGDIIKVTPSSKVVGDLAQFMVQNNLSEHDVMERAATLSFPSSVVEFFQGYIGHPAGGFPEPLRSMVTRGQGHIEGRPGASMAPLNFEALRAELHATHSEEGAREIPRFAAEHVPDTDLMSAAMYPKEFGEFKAFRSQYGDVSQLDTHDFIAPLKPGEEITVDIESGKRLLVRYLTTGELNEDGQRQVFFDVNGMPRSIFVQDRNSDAANTRVLKDKADPSNPGSLGAPMPGAVVDVRVAVGDVVEQNQPCVVLNAMKMETVVSAPFKGVVKKVSVHEGDSVNGKDLLVEIAPLD